MTTSTFFVDTNLKIFVKKFASILLHTTKRKKQKKTAIIFNDSVFGWHASVEWGQFQPDERGGWLSCLLLCVGSGSGSKSPFWRQTEESRRTGGVKRGKKPVSKLDTMGKAVLHHGANMPVCTFIAWLCACDCAAINGVQVRARALRPAGSGNQTKHMIECFVLWQPTFAICHWKEARLIACTSRLARSTKRLKCEVSVGAREGVRWCVCLGRCGASSARYSSTAAVPAVIQEPLEAGWVMRRNSFH